MKEIVHNASLKGIGYKCQSPCQYRSMSYSTARRCHRSFPTRHPIQNTFVLYTLAYPGCMCGTRARREACLNRMLMARSELVTVPSRTWPPGIAIFRRYSGTAFATMRLIPTSMT